MNLENRGNRNVSPSEQDFLSELISRGPLSSFFLLFSLFIFFSSLVIRAPGTGNESYLRESKQTESANERVSLAACKQNRGAGLTPACSTTVSWIIGTGSSTSSNGLSLSLLFLVSRSPLSPRNTDFNPVWICRRPTREGPGLSISFTSPSPPLSVSPVCNAGDSFESTAACLYPWFVISINSGRAREKGRRTSVAPIMRK